MTALFAVSFLPKGTLRTVLSIVSGLISSFSVGALFAVAYSIPSQLAAEDEARTGITRSAMYFAVQGLFAGVASGIATGIVLVVLKQYGGMSYLTLISAIAMIVSLAGTWLLPQSIARLGKKEKTDNSQSAVTEEKPQSEVGSGENN